ncbi:hypothetical protein COP2_009580 [Malus domestica]
MLNSFQLESIGEDTVVADRKQCMFNFVPALRSRKWSNIGDQTHMENTYLCIGDLAKKFGYNLLSEEAISFYGVSFSRPCKATWVDREDEHHRKATWVDREGAERSRKAKQKRR